MISNSNMLNNLFTLDQLKTFYTIVQTGSFKKAANSLYISQPTVSTQIKKLECQLNTQLLQRNKKGIFLTKSGSQLYKHTSTILNTCENIKLDLNRVKVKSKSELKVSVDKNTNTSYIIYLLKLFQMYHPQINITIDLSNQTYFPSKLQRNPDIISFTNSIREFKYSEETLDIKIISNEKIVLVVPNSCTLNAITREQLETLPFVKLKNEEPRLRDFLEKNKINGSGLKTRMELSTINEVCQAVKSNIGVAFLITSMLPDIEGIKCYEPSNGPTMNILYSVTNFKVIPFTPIKKFHNFIKFLRTSN